MMKAKVSELLLCAGVAFAAPFAAIAGPLVRSDVAANPAWLVHVDLDRLRATPIGRYILSELDKPEVKANLAAFESATGIDPRTQLHGATLFGTDPLSEDGVLIVYADFDADRLVGLAKGAEDYQSTPHNQRMIHSWIDDKKKSADNPMPRIYASIHGKRVIFSRREAPVAQALDVLDGARPNLGAADAFAELGAKDNKHLVEAAARKMNLPSSAPNAAVLKLCKSLQLVLSEEQEQLRGTLTLVTDSKDVAGPVSSILQGLVALMKLQPDRPAAAKVAGALKFNQEEDRVECRLSLPCEAVVQLIQEDAARKASSKGSK